MLSNLYTYIYLYISILVRASREDSFYSVGYGQQILSVITIFIEQISIISTLYIYILVVVL